MQQRMKDMFARYGKVALVVYFVIFAVSMVGFSTAITMGFDVQGAAGGASTVAAAWVATKVAQPLRILLTLALTPLFARFLPDNTPNPTKVAGE